MLSSGEIRDIFIRFFESNGHIYVKPSHIVNRNDPTLMFTNAGMNQFKDIFLGNCNSQYKRVTNSQLCLRVSGKHNDLEEVGVDGYHHTLFEMLGNWSMDDYFKKDAITMAFELLTQEYKIEKDRLYVTVFFFFFIDKTCFDKESFEIWSNLVDEDHIVLGNKKDNFWEMGNVGPCGSCTEIHIDLRCDDDRKSIHGKELVNKGTPEVIEIWNIVFVEFERLDNGKLRRLDKHFVDTGMGFERLVMVLQGKKSNYDTDLFFDYLCKLEQMTGIKYKNDDVTDVAMRVIVDHIRSIVITVAEGLKPGNILEGYVIRRIIRRAVRYGYSFLNLKQPFLYEFVDVVLNKYNVFKYNFIVDSEEIKRIVYNEEKSFFNTLRLGIKRIDDIVSCCKNSNTRVVDGGKVFEMYDTYGFPVDLTEMILKEDGISFDKRKFDELLLEQKKRSKNDVQRNDIPWNVVNDGASVFVGYDNIETQSKILRYRIIEEDNKNFLEVVFDITPFYGESGGQVGDIGFAFINDKCSFEIIDTKKINGDMVHVFNDCFIDDSFDVNTTFLLKINNDRRALISRHHSATHILQAVLRQMFGDDLHQMGSKVSADKLRFDFNIDRNLTQEEILMVEKNVNDIIKKGKVMIEERDVDINEAKKNGAMMLFGNKYGDKVRIISFDDISKELCGGTHVKNTKEIGIFTVLKCKNISSGVRRIEAKCS